MCARPVFFGEKITRAGYLSSILFATCGRGGSRPLGVAVSSRWSLSCFEWNHRRVVEPEVAVIDLERQGRERRTVDPATLGPIKAVVRLPASSLMARGRLKPDDPVADLGVPF
jgi:hypothetical protein